MRPTCPTRLTWRSDPRFVPNKRRLDYEPPRGVADEIEGVAGDQRERRMVRRIEYVDVVRRDNQRLADLVVVDAVGRRELHCIAGMDVTERTKHGVAMAGDADVASSSGKWRVLDVAGSAAQRTV